MSTQPTSNIEDLLFTDVDFLNVNDGSQPTTANAGGTPTEPVVTPQATQPTNEPFLKGKVSVYNSREDAIKSLDEKDDKIEYLRNFAINKFGVDPFKPEQVANLPAHQPTAQPQATQPVDESYVNNPDKYVKDLTAAWEKGDMKSYAQIQQRFAQESAMQIIAPFAPIMQQNIKSSAVEAVSKQVKDFNTAFFDTPEYKDVLKENTVLADAIKNAESHVQFRDQLPELYRIAHGLAQNKKVPDLVRQAQATATPTTPQARPTAAPSTMNPPTPSNEQNWRTDPAARKAYLDRMRQGGAERLPLSITRTSGT